MIEYLFESTLCLAIFYLVYEVCLKDSSRYEVNRFVLLLSPFFSVLVPIFDFSLDALPVQVTENGDHILELLPVSKYMPSSDIGKTNGEGADFINILSPIFIIYTIVSLVLLLRFVLHLKTLFFKWSRSEKVNYKGHTLTLMEEKIPPFTFFHAIFINREVYESEKFSKELIVHEIAHKYQYHSIDIVAMELLQILFWFNPFIHLFKRKIKTNHEYLADSFVIQCGTDSKVYANQLLKYTFPHKITGFASAFNTHFTIKNRLIMLSRFQNRRPKAYRFLLLIPITALLFISTAFNETNVLENIPPIWTQEDKLLENPGILYADKIVWQSSDNEIYLTGDNIRIVHGDNDFSVNGRASYLGEVHCFILNNEPVPKDVSIDVSGMECSVVKLSPKNAEEEYGTQGKYGAVVILTNKP